MNNVNRFKPNTRRYTKTNFVELLERLIPDIYTDEDLALSGSELNPVSELINCHINLANNISTVLSISSIPNTQTKNLGNISGISQYFVKQNDLTEITPYEFETQILLPLGTSLANFDTSSEFVSYLSSNLLPKIRVATATQAHALQQNISTLSALTSNVNASSVHNYLVDTLGWFYFLNTSANGGLSYSPSSYVLESLNSLYLGNTLNTVDGIKGLTEYLWRNNSVCSFDRFIPTNFISGTSDGIMDPSAGIPATYTSGIQKLENLKTLVDVVYSPLYIDKTDYRVKEAFDDFISTRYYLTDRSSKGPLRKFLNMLGYSMADLSDQIENIGLIYDLQNVRDEHLELIADLIGFKLKGSSPTKWRHQLSVAVDIYKSTGTLEAIQAVINALVIDSVFDLKGKVQELWESYLPQLIWYSLYTESPLFKNLNTWNKSIALQGGVYEYSTRNIEDNLKIVTDSILLDLYKQFPQNFLYAGKTFDPPRFYLLDSQGNQKELYTIVGEPNMRSFRMYEFGGREYLGLKRSAIENDESKSFEAATVFGPLGLGVYFTGLGSADSGSRPTYIKFTGDFNFLFNYRNKNNYPLPPFEEYKYYKDSTISPDMVDFLVERLKCFKVRKEFADQLKSFLIENAVSNTTDLSVLNEWLMFFSERKTPPNFDEVMNNITAYDKNILSLWNGKSSHLFVGFEDSDFDFGKTTLESDGKDALYQASRTIKEFSPAHAILRMNVTGRYADETFTISSTEYDYIELDQDDLRTGYTQSSVLAGYQFSGVAMSFAGGGGDSASLGSDSGRGGLNTFKRDRVDQILDSLVSSTQAVLTAPRRDLRRRNFKYLLPRESYYDRTGFNGPVSFDTSVLERSLASSLGELTLGYVASAGKFHPIVDPVNPSGVWHFCEDLSSQRQFSGIFTSSTFPYRGLYTLGSNAKMPEEGSRTSRYIDRGQIPEIYITMHELFTEKAKSYASKLIEDNSSEYLVDQYWKNTVESLANTLIASGFVLNSLADYENFSFGSGLHKLFKDYCIYFAKHALTQDEKDKTGGNIFAHVFGNGLFNCNFSLAGSGGTSYISKTLDPISSISTSTVWKSSTVGTSIASSLGDCVIPLSGTFTVGNAFNAEFRNPHILSGVEFCDISGATSRNSFTIFNLDPSTAIKGKENYLVNNTVIKCKSFGGLPRIRFDLSAYGERRNYLIKDHQFKLRVLATVGEETSPVLGGGKLGVWIHTKPQSGVFWSWTQTGRWERFNETDLSIDSVLNNLCHTYAFSTKQIYDPSSTYKCLDTYIQVNDPTDNPRTINNISRSYLETVEVSFDTRNYTTNNNYEYLQVLPILDSDYQKVNQVHTDNTNYIVEVFFIPTDNANKYLLIDSVELYDLTLLDNAGIGTGYGTETDGIPLKKFVKEDKLYLTKDQLLDTLKFFTGLIGQNTGEYYTNLASRNATITSGVLELSGGSRLNYRISPDWVPNTKAATYNNYTTVEFDN